MKNVYDKFFSDLVFISIWIIVTIIFIITPFLENNFIRIILGIPMVIFIPGYMLVSALFIKRDALDTIERIALSFGLSIAVVPLLGLLLSFTFGIGLSTILVILCIYDAVLIFISKYRREKLPENERFSVMLDRIYEIVGIKLKPKNRIDSILNIILIFTMIIAIGMIYFTITAPKISDKFTEFYIIDADGKTSNYSTDLKLGSASYMDVYVSNHEYKYTNYTIQMVLNKNILISKELALDHDEIWEGNMTFVPQTEGINMRLEFLLFKENNFTVPYRSLHLTVNAI